MVFKSEAELKSYVLARCSKAVANAEQKVHNVIDSFLKTYYGEFTPEEYIRTNQLMHSLVKTGVKGTGNGFEAEVYFDAGKLNYEQGVMPLQHTPEHGRYGWATWTGDKVLDTAMNGSHGGYVGGTPIWSASMSQLGNITELLKQELIKQGIPIK